MDNIAALQHKGFTIEPSRGSVERGQTKAISISWTPPIDFDVGAWEPAPPGEGWGASVGVVGSALKRKHVPAAPPD